MPVVSQAQRAAMYAAEEGHSTLGIPKKVGADFVNASHGITGLPERVGKKKRGRRGGKKVRERQALAAARHATPAPPKPPANIAGLRNRLHTIATRGKANG